MYFFLHGKLVYEKNYFSSHFHLIFFDLTAFYKELQGSAEFSIPTTDDSG